MGLCMARVMISDTVRERDRVKVKVKVRVRVRVRLGNGTWLGLVFSTWIASAAVCPSDTITPAVTK